MSVRLNDGGFAGVADRRVHPVEMDPQPLVWFYWRVQCQEESLSFPSWCLVSREVHHHS